jgi:hypothetical protein
MFLTCYEHLLGDRSGALTMVRRRIKMKSYRVKNVDTLVFESLIVAMLCKLQRLDPRVRTKISGTLKNAALSIESWAKDENNQAALLSGLGAIKGVGDLVLANPDGSKK